MVIKNDYTKLRSQTALRPSMANHRRMIAEIKRWETRIARSRPVFNQAKHLQKQFGGLLQMCIAAGSSLQTAYDWNDAYQGLVPTFYLINLVKNARRFGVLLRPKDLYPDLIDYDRVRARNYGDNRAWTKEILKATRHKDLAFHDRLASLASTQAKQER